MPNPTPTPAPALGALPEEIETAISEYGDAVRDLSEWTSASEVRYRDVRNRADDVHARLVAAITAALSQGEADAARRQRVHECAMLTLRGVRSLADSVAHARERARGGVMITREMSAAIFTTLCDYARLLELDEPRSTDAARAGEASHG